MVLVQWFLIFDHFSHGVLVKIILIKSVVGEGIRVFTHSTHGFLLLLGRSDPTQSFLRIQYFLKEPVNSVRLSNFLDSDPHFLKLSPNSYPKCMLEMLLLVLDFVRKVSRNASTYKIVLIKRKDCF